MISNGSLITEKVARGIIEAGLDAINISVDAGGKEVFEQTRIGLNYDKVIANIERLVRIRAELGRRRPKLILVVRPPEQLRRRAGVHRALAQRRRQDPHHRAPQLGRHAEPRIRRQLSLLPAVADLHGPVGRPGLALLRRLRRQDDPGRPEYPVDRRHLECRALPGRAPGAPRERRARRLPRLRFAAKRLPFVDHQAGLSLPRLTRYSEARQGCRARADVLRGVYFEGEPTYEKHSSAVRVRGGPGRRRLPLPASAGELKLTMQNGRVTIIADNVPLRQILQEWARVGQTKIVNADKMSGPGDHAAAGRRARTGRARYPAAIRQRLHRGAAAGAGRERRVLRSRDDHADEPRAGRRPPAT